MVSQESASKAAGIQAELERLTNQHRDYRIAQSLGSLDSAERTRVELTTLLENLSRMENGPLTELDKKIAATAALVASVGQGDDRPKHDDYLQHALILALEHKLGRTDKARFQETVRFLLAHSSEGYEPFCTLNTVKVLDEWYRERVAYDVFSDASRKKIVLLEQGEMGIHTVGLKTPYGLDDLLDDFKNYVNGTSQKIKSAPSTGGLVFAAIVTGVVLGIGAGYAAGHIAESVLLPSPEEMKYMWWQLKPIYDQISKITLITGLGTFVAGTIGSCIGYLKWDKYDVERVRKKEEANFPHEYIKSGVSALMDAFPLTSEVPTMENAEAQRQRAIQKVTT